MNGAFQGACRIIFLLSIHPQCLLTIQSISAKSLLFLHSLLPSYIQDQESPYVSQSSECFIKVILTVISSLIIYELNRISNFTSTEL